MGPVHHTSRPLNLMMQSAVCVEMSGQFNNKTQLNTESQCMHQISNCLLENVKYCLGVQITRHAFLHIFMELLQSYWRWDGRVSAVPRLQAGKARNHGSIPGRGKGFFSSLKHPERLKSAPASFAMGTRSTFSVGYMAGILKLTTHLHLLSSLRMNRTTHGLINKPLRYAQRQLYFMLGHYHELI
jgi:hypothetical protein